MPSATHLYYIKFKAKKFFFRLAHFLLRKKDFLRVRYLLKNKSLSGFSDDGSFSGLVTRSKLSKSRSVETLCASKVGARDYVKDKLGERYLIPLLDVFDKAEDFNASKMPNQYILKASHGSGWNFLVKNNKEVDEREVRLRMGLWLDDNYYYYGMEEQYRFIRPQVVAEELLLDESGQPPPDFKFYCFGRGGENLIVCQVDVDRFGDHGRVFYDENWSKLPYFILSSKSKPFYGDIQKPCLWAEMIECAKKLSSEFEFSRIDLYYHEGSIYFGEITFHPESGYGIFVDPPEYDRYLGDKLFEGRGALS